MGRATSVRVRLRIPCSYFLNLSRDKQEIEQDVCSWLNKFIHWVHLDLQLLYLDYCGVIWGLSLKSRLQGSPTVQWHMHQSQGIAVCS